MLDLSELESPDVRELLEVNRGFYQAFEGRSMAEMSAIWEHSPRVTCTHPGWAPIRGWIKVAAAWYALFTNSERIRFEISDQEVCVEGKIGWVTCFEDIIEDGKKVARATAFNVFTKNTTDSWLMVAHVAGPAPLGAV